MTTITDDEREAREWLRKAIVHDGGKLLSPSLQADKHRATILALLDAPRMPRPEDVPDEVLHAMWQASGPRPGTVSERGRIIYQALYDHYAAPPQPVAVWGVLRLADGMVLSTHKELEDAHGNVPHVIDGPRRYRIVRLVEDRDDQ